MTADSPLTFWENVSTMKHRFENPKAVKAYSKRLHSIREGRPSAESLPGFL